MGFRFRRRIKVLPGLWLNASKSGISTSIGGRGLTVNVKSGRTRTTVGLPGTGTSYSESPKTGPSPFAPAPARSSVRVLLWLALVLAVAFVVFMVSLAGP